MGYQASVSSPERRAGGGSYSKPDSGNIIAHHAPDSGSGLRGRQKGRNTTDLYNAHSPNRGGQDFARISHNNSQNFQKSLYGGPQDDINDARSSQKLPPWSNPGGPPDKMANGGGDHRNNRFSESLDPYNNQQSGEDIWPSKQGRNPGPDPSS